MHLDFNPNVQKLNTLESKYLSFKLGEEQKDVLLSIFYFIKNGKNRQCTLDGFGGSGKTTLTKLIIRFLEQERVNYVLAAPTHKAKGVLSALTEREATTIHQLLTLKPTIDIMDLDYKDLRFVSKTLDNSIPSEGVVIIDECSMINEPLFDHIVKVAESKDCKIIWIGDYAQICPVKEKKLSKAFELEEVYKLTKVYRQQGDNPILDLLYELRNEPKRIFNPIESEHGSLILYNNWKKMFEKNMHLFREMLENKDTSHVKMITYTNNRVVAFNNIIRQELFNNDDEYNVGDILMAYDSCEYKLGDHMGEYKISNSDDYIIRSIIPLQKMICGVPTNGYMLELYSVGEDIDIEIYILSRQNTPQTFLQIAYEIESIRMQAINTLDYKAKNRVWVKYFKAMGSFLTPIDLVYDGRVVRKKSLDYGYALTSHKS